MPIDNLTKLINQSEFALLDTNIYVINNNNNKWFHNLIDKNKFNQLNISDLKKAKINLNNLNNHYLRNNTFTVPFVINQLEFMTLTLHKKNKYLLKKNNHIKKIKNYKSTKSEYRLQELQKIVSLGKELIKNSYKSQYNITQNKQYEIIFKLCKTSENLLMDLGPSYMRKGRLEDQLPVDAQLATTAIIRAHNNQPTDLFTPDLKLINIITTTIDVLQHNYFGLNSEGKYSNITYYGIRNIGRITPINLNQKKIRLFTTKDFN